MSVTLLTMGAGNVVVLEKTLQAFSGICDEVIYGDLLLFPEDRLILDLYRKKFNVTIVTYKFDYIFKYGFASILNSLAKYAKNKMCLYMNTSEVIDEDYGAAEIINSNPDCNSFYFIHRTDPHRWFRCYNKLDLHWSGMIHEQLKGEFRPYHKPIFMMADLEKDMYSPFKARAFNSVKEIVYFQQYMAIADNPEMLGETDASWYHFAKKDYDSFKDRLLKKGDQYEAFLKGDYYKLMSAFYDPKFQEEEFKSSTTIEYQGDPQFLGKKQVQ